MALNNGKNLAAENRRSQVLQMKMAGATETAIAEQVGISKTQVHNDIHRRLAEVRRDDKEAVQQEYNLQRSRYERLLLRWWSQATGGGAVHTLTAGGCTLVGRLPCRPGVPRRGVF